MIIAVLGITFSQAQTQVYINFDIRGRDCNGGRGICSASKTNAPNNKIRIQNIGDNTFVLSISRSSLSEKEETGIAGKFFSGFQSGFPNTFTQNEDVEFSNDVLKTLGVNPRFNLLKTGNYPMSIDETEVKIILTLSKGGKT